MRAAKSSILAGWSAQTDVASPFLRFPVFPPTLNESDADIPPRPSDDASGPTRVISRQFIRFAIAGTLGFVVDAGVLYIALACGLGPFVGRVVSFLAAVWATWRVNRRYTFHDRAERSVWVEWWRYLVSMLGGAAVNYLAYSVVILTLHAGHFTPLIAVACGSVAGMFVNFAAAKYWAFKG